MVNKTEVLKRARKLIIDGQPFFNYLCNAIYVSHKAVDEGKSTREILEGLPHNISIDRRELLGKEYPRIQTRIQMELKSRHDDAATFTSVMDFESVKTLRLEILDTYIKMEL